MSFWSGEKLAGALPGLISPFDPDRLDCASYRLCVGDQAFVTSEKMTSADPNEQLVSVLGNPPAHMVRILPGQFAFLLTHEEVVVPRNAIALISMRAKYKFRGLINVSGFHVDPGWKGKLLFSVYNAGPSAVIVEREEPLFLIVYADLDRDSVKIYKGDAQGQKSIRPALLANLTSQVFSPQVLQQRLEKVHEQMAGILFQTRVSASVATALGVITALVIAAVALLPSWTGVVIARTLDAANYEIRQKTESGSERESTRAGKPRTNQVQVPAEGASRTTR